MLTHALRRRRVPVFAALLVGSAAATVDSQTTTEAEFRHATCRRSWRRSSGAWANRPTRRSWNACGRIATSDGGHAIGKRFVIFCARRRAVAGASRVMAAMRSGNVSSSPALDAGLPAAVRSAFACIEDER